jgi:excisionase family DNA binding protein
MLQFTMEVATYQSAILTIEEVAEYIHVVPLTVYRMIKRDDLPMIKVGRVWRIRQQDLQSYLHRTAGRSRGGKENR